MDFQELESLVAGFTNSRKEINFNLGVIGDFLEEKGEKLSARLMRMLIEARTTGNSSIAGGDFQIRFPIIKRSFSITRCLVRISVGFLASIDYNLRRGWRGLSERKELVAESEMIYQQATDLILNLANFDRSQNAFSDEVKTSLRLRNMSQRMCLPARSV